MLAAAVVAAAAVYVLVLAPDDKGAADAGVFAECAPQLQPVVAELDAVDARLDVGLNQEAYSTAVGDLSVALNSVAPAPECVEPRSALARAVDIHARASGAWNSCITDTYCDFEGDKELALQRDWLLAALAAEQGKAMLGLLRREDGSQVSSDDVSDAQARLYAESAQMAAETFALRHGGSYEQLNEEALADALGETPSDWEVAEAGRDTYEIRVTSDSGRSEYVARSLLESSEIQCNSLDDGGCPSVDF